MFLFNYNSHTQATGRIFSVDYFQLLKSRHDQATIKEQKKICSVISIIPSYNFIVTLCL